MRYFTKEWYNEMQVYGFLAFPDSKEEWEESVQYYQEEGIDYKKNAKEDLESRKSDLLKFLPEPFHHDHYESIKSQLPKNVVQIHENSLHDATIKSFESHSKDTFIMILHCSGGFHYFTDIKLTFTGVSKLIMPEKFEGAWWLYDEVYRSDKYFELNVLFDCPLTEFSIIAENVVIEQLRLQ